MYLIEWKLEKRDKNRREKQTAMRTNCVLTFQTPLSLTCLDVSVHGSAKATKIESSCLNEIPLQMLPMGMWGPENMKIKKFRWGLFEFYIFLS